MTDQNSNPFVLPGMGQGSSETAGNPLLASMEMMRQAWSGLMGPGGLAQALPMTPPMNLQDLERRIAELRTVESWLRMNLSMLSSTIQGLEVQRSTIATLRSFVESMGAQAQDPAASAEASPLEVALGLKPAPRQAAAGQTEGGRESRFGADRSGDRQGADPGQADRHAGASTPVDSFPRPGASAEAPPSGAPDAASSNTGAQDAFAGAASAGSPQAISQAAQSASEAWWGMLQQQFNQLAAATAATMPGAVPGTSPAQSGATATGAAPGQDAPGEGKTAARAASSPKADASRKRAPPARRAAPRKAVGKKNKIQSGSDQS